MIVLNMIEIVKILYQKKKEIFKFYYIFDTTIHEFLLLFMIG